MLFFARAIVLSRYLQNSISIDIERNSDLRNSTRSRKNTVKIEAPNRRIVSSHLTFTLNDMNLYARLVVGSSGERLRLGSRNSSVSLDKSSTNTTERFDSNGKRCYIKKQNIFDISLKNTSLNRSSNSHYFVWVDRAVWLLAKQLGYHLYNCWHSSHSTNENNLVDFAGCNTCVL